MMQCTCWRQHSKNYPKGVTPPQTLESLQAAWDRDQEVMFEMQKEISRLKLTINKLRQKTDRGQPLFTVVHDGMVNIDSDQVAYSNIRGMYKNSNGSGIQFSSEMSKERSRKIQSLCDSIARQMYELEDELTPACGAGVAPQRFC